jgi:hypothetical protein
VDLHHSHHDPTVGHRWSVAAWVGGEIAGVVIVGNPVAGPLNDGKTFEVARLCVISNQKNVASRLLGAAWRASKAMGCNRLVSYTRVDETGHCYLAAGWSRCGRVKGRDWTSGNKKTRWLPGFYSPSTEIVDRVRWEIGPAAAAEIDL